MKVVAAVDGSPRSFGALKFASRSLSPKCDDITLYFSPPRFLLSGKSETTTDLTELAQSALAESVFKEAKQHLPATFDSLVSTVQGENTPVNGILAIADKNRADLIVLGAHGATRRLQLFLGGVARGVAHQATQPVLVVRGNEERDSDEMNIMIACDDKSAWQDAAAVLRDFSWPDYATATLFHVVEEMDSQHLSALAEQPFVDSENLVHEYREHVARRTTSTLDRLESAREGLPQIVRSAQAVVAQGHVVEQIVKKVREDKIDLLVVSARKLGRVRRLLGSTTEALLIQCPCSLLIVHQQEQP